MDNCATFFMLKKNCSKIVHEYSNYSNTCLTGRGVVVQGAWNLLFNHGSFSSDPGSNPAWGYKCNGCLLACLSLSSVMSSIRSDTSIWKPVFPNFTLPNKVADRVKCSLELWYNTNILNDKNTLSCPSKSNSKRIELTLHTSCYWCLRLTLCYSA